MIWGGRLEDFHTMARTCESILLFFAGFVFDNVSTDMFEGGGGLGIIWVWLFFIFAVMLLLNFAVVVILDVYMEVKAKAGPVADTQDTVSALTWRSHLLGRRVFALLADKESHPELFVSSDALANTLNANGLEIDKLLACVSAQSMGCSAGSDIVPGEDATSLTDAMRLCGRI